MKTALLLMALLVIPIASALDTCLDEVPILDDCRMLTPTLICDEYNYSIWNDDGEFQESGNLTLLNGSLYYFDFTLGEGEYIVELCDGSTREVAVVEDHPKMWYTGFFWLGSILLFLISRGKHGEKMQIFNILQLGLGFVFGIRIFAFSPVISIVVIGATLAIFAGYAWAAEMT